MIIIMVKNASTQNPNKLVNKRYCYIYIYTLRKFILLFSFIYIYIYIYIYIPHTSA